jgi:hypothetical protein
MTTAIDLSDKPRRNRCTPLARRIYPVADRDRWQHHRKFPDGVPDESLEQIPAAFS